MIYLTSIKIAFLIFPFIALLITIPYILIQYHKYGSINKLRVLIIYSFILYLLVIYFLVILPLPPIDVVKNLTSPKYQLIPFNFIIDFIKDIKSKYDGKNILVVAHNGVISVLSCMLEGIPKDNNFENCGIKNGDIKEFII